MNDKPSRDWLNRMGSLEDGRPVSARNPYIRSDLHDALTRRVAQLEGALGAVRDYLADCNECCPCPYSMVKIASEALATESKEKDDDN